MSIRITSNGSPLATRRARSSQPRAPFAAISTSRPARRRMRADQALVVGPVLDEQHAPRQLRRRLRDAAAGSARGEARRASAASTAHAVERSRRHAQRKRLPRPELALDVDVAAEQPREPAREREPEARARVNSRVVRALHLRERLEEPLDARARRCRCRVSIDGDLEQVRPRRVGATRPTSIAHPPALGELDRVADQVDQDLAQRACGRSRSSRGSGRPRRSATARALLARLRAEQAPRPRRRCRPARSARARPRACPPRSSTGRGCR